jgi:hypothetical protein
MTPIMWGVDKHYIINFPWVKKHIWIETENLMECSEVFNAIQRG